MVFRFYFKDMLLPNSSKIGQSGGLLLLFPHQDVQKVLKMKKISSAWKLLKLAWGSILGQKKDSRCKIYLNRLIRTLILPSRPLTPGAWGTPERPNLIRSGVNQLTTNRFLLISLYLCSARIRDLHRKFAIFWIGDWQHIGVYLLLWRFIRF